MSTQYDAQSEQVVDESRASIYNAARLNRGSGGADRHRNREQRHAGGKCGEWLASTPRRRCGRFGAAQSATNTTWIAASVTPVQGKTSSEIPNAPTFRASNGFPGVPDAKSDGIQGFTVNPAPQTTPPTSNAGVFGRNNDLNGVGTWGEAPNGTGAFGDSSSGSGVAGSSNTGTGLYGQSTSGAGAQGFSSSGIGLYGQSSSGVGISGLSTSSYGIVGVTAAGGPFSGITGGANANGAAAFAGGTSNPAAYAAYFTGSVVVNGPFTVVDPTQKHGAIKFRDGSYNTLYSMESPEPWLEDFGTATFTNGSVNVNLPTDFANIVKTNDYHVFLAEVDGHHHLTVQKKTATGFTVQADPEIAALKGKNAADLTGTVSWRVVAKPQTDKKADRLAKFELPKIKIPGVDADLPKVDRPTVPASRPKK